MCTTPHVRIENSHEETVCPVNTLTMHVAMSVSFVLCVRLMERVACSCVCMFCIVCEYVYMIKEGGGTAGGLLRCSAKKAEYPGVRWKKCEWER